MANDTLTYVLLFVWLAALIPWVYFYVNAAQRLRTLRGTDGFRAALARFVAVHTLLVVAITLIPVALLYITSPWLGQTAAVGLLCMSPVIALGHAMQVLTGWGLPRFSEK